MFKEFQKKREEQAQSPKIETKTTPTPSSIDKPQDKPVLSKPNKSTNEKDNELMDRSTAFSVKTEVLEDLSFDRNDSKSLDNSIKSKTLDDLFEAVKELEKVEKFQAPPYTDKSFASESTVTLADGETGGTILVCFFLLDYKWYEFKLKMPERRMESSTK